MAGSASLPLVVVGLDRELLGGVPVDPDVPAERRPLDLGVLPYFEDERPLQGLAGLVDWRSGGRLSSLLREGFCSGRTGEAVLLLGGRTLPATRWVLIGLGASPGFADERAHAAAGRIVSIATRLLPRDVLLAMPGRAGERAAVEAVFRGLTDGLRSVGPRGVAHDPEPRGATWWVVAENRHVARLRRLLEGPPRAASE